MKTKQGNLTHEDRALIRRLIEAGCEVRKTIRPDADMVDASVHSSLDDLRFPKTEYGCRVAWRAFARYVPVDRPAVAAFRKQEARKDAARKRERALRLASV